MNLRIIIPLLSLLLFACTGPDKVGRDSTTRIPPIYSYAGNEDGTSYGYNAFFHMVKRDVEPDGAYAHVIPFYFHSWDDEGDSFSLVPPFYYHRKRIFSEDTFYLATGKKTRGSRNDYYAIWPLIRFTTFDNQPKRWEAFFFPLYDMVRDEGRRHLKLVDLSYILGLFVLLDMEWGIPPSGPGASTGNQFSLFNVFNLARLASGRTMGGYRDFELLTLFSSEKMSLYHHHWSKEEGGDGRTVLFPVYWRFRDDEGEALHLWPLYGWDESSEGDRRDHLLYPLFMYGRNQETGSWTVDAPWPLIRVERGEEGTSENRFLPLYMDRHTASYDFSMLFPLYASYGDTDGYRRHFYTPLLSTYEDAEEEEWGVDLPYPLVSLQRSPSRSHERILPLYYRTAEDDDTHLAMFTPLVWSSKNQEGSRFDLAFPLYAHWGQGKDDHIHSLIPIFKLLADRPKQERAGRRQVDLLWPLAGYGSYSERTVAWFFPFFNHVNDKDLLQWGFVADLFDFEVKRSRKTFTFLWFIPISWGGDEEDR
jgi:hypothetical protein